MKQALRDTRSWFGLALSLTLTCVAPAAAAERTIRLYEGVTAYVVNERGVDFTVNLEVRDLNLMAGGPRELLVKVYDPDGAVVVREFIPDDGVVSANFPERIAGWDHELQYYASLYALGTTPTVRFSAWSDPARLRTLASRSFRYDVTGAKKGVYRVLLAGASDHYVTLSLTPELPYGLSGHSTFLHGHGSDLATSYLYVPRDTTGLFLAVIEPDEPRSRRFTLTAPDGKVLFTGAATGGYRSGVDENGRGGAIPFERAGQYDGQLLRLEVSDGPGDFLVKAALLQPSEGPFKARGGMGCQAVFAPDEQTAQAVAGGTFVADGLLFWHPFQRRFHEWLNTHPLDADDAQRALRAELEALFNQFRLLETSDGVGSASWTNWAYTMGYYSFDVFRPCWTLMGRDDVPEQVKAILREGLIMAGDRLSMATGIERVNGNAFAFIPVSLWYGHRATGDTLQKERFEIFFDRWRHEGWGVGAGLSRSGDAQEHFAHDMHYGSYLLDTWGGGKTWIKYNILDDAPDEPRFAQVLDRYRELYSYLHCQLADGTVVPANPWSSRTHMGAAHGLRNWQTAARPWKGAPGPDFTVSVNGGDEWFAARRAGYYVLTFHGRLAPWWMSQTFQGQLGFGGGIICQLTVPGRGPVLASTLEGSYGQGMHPANWANFHLHSLVGQLWDGRPLVSAISEHLDARLDGQTLTSSGEVRDAHVRVRRSYTFGPDDIDCAVALEPSDYERVLSIWTPQRNWSQVKRAYEMIPYVAKGVGGRAAVVTAMDADGRTWRALSHEPVQAAMARIDAGGFGVDVVLEQPLPVMLGANATVLIQLVADTDKPAPATAVKLRYRLVPFDTERQVSGAD